MGMYCNVFAASPREIEILLDDPESIDDVRLSEEVDLEKAWHGIHYLLTGDLWETREPFGFLVSGGRPIGKADGSYWPIRLVRPEEVKSLANALSAVSDEEFWSRFDAQVMNDLGVYPIIWDEDEDDLREEYLGYFHDLQAFLSQAASDGATLVVQTPKLGGIGGTP